MSDWFEDHPKTATLVLFVVAFCALTAFGLVAAGDWLAAVAVAVVGLVLWQPISRTIETGVFRR